MMSVVSTVSSTSPHDLFNPSVAAHRLARLARQALIAEAELTPKPGLVDRRGNGAHTDLSLDRMRRSAVALEPYFFQMAMVARGVEPSAALRAMLALIGRRAERAMFAATGGSNSHKGAIWTLGLLTAALAIHDEHRVSAATVALTAQAIASFDDKAAPRLVSHGDVMARRYGVAGARGEALGGFPHVVEVALPVLRAKRREGAAEEVARLDALLGIMSSLDDTCLLYRGGQAALDAAKQGACAVEAAGGTGTALGRECLWQLDDRLLALNASPGGSADLLAAALFLDAVEQGLDDVQRMRAQWRCAMETIEFDYPAKRQVSGRAHVGVVGSGDLEVLLEPAGGASSHVLIRTSVDGFRDTWKAVLDRFFSTYDGVVSIQINDAGATPGSVQLRLEQAVEVSES